MPIASTARRQKKKTSPATGARAAAPTQLDLPIKPAFAPMEARTRDELPDEPGWQYEPKWDGFRCLIFRDGDQVYLQSKAARPLARYFPDIAAAALTLRARRFVLDGEIVIPVAGRLSFDELLMRIHPAASRVAKLAREHPAMFVLFDLLVDDRGRSLVDEPLSARRPLLEAFAKAQLRPAGTTRNGAARGHDDPAATFCLSPATTDLAVARRWFKAAGGNLDGVIAKRLDLPYRSGERDGMIKIKHHKTADCVVGGFRYAEKPQKGRRVVGSLLLGLYDHHGKLNHVGFTSSFNADQRTSITTIMSKRAGGSGFTGRAPGGPSRWSTRRTDEWIPVDPDLVVEVQYDHFTGHRFRHGVTFARWRPDKEPASCSIDQVARREGATMALLTRA